MLHEGVVTRGEAFRAIGSNMTCDRVRLLAQGEFNEEDLNAALIFLEAVKGEKQRIIDKKPFTPDESEQAGEWLEDMVDALKSLGKNYEEGTIQELQETLSSIKEGKTPSGEKVAEARAFFGALGKLYYI